MANVDFTYVDVRIPCVSCGSWHAAYGTSNVYVGLHEGRVVGRSRCLDPTAFVLSRSLRVHHVIVDGDGYCCAAQAECVKVTDSL